MTDLPNRTASASLKGYLYQFDRTIVEILSAKDAIAITIEGIEDIDVDGERNEAIQCKYLDASKFSLAAIRDAVLPMLKSSLQNKDLKYRLYIYCGNGGVIPSELTVAQLKECLTLKKKDGTVILYYEDIAEQDLAHFVRALTIVAGEEFEESRAQVHTLIQAELRCSAEDSFELYYGKALSTVYDLAILKDIQQRKISKPEFIKTVNTKEALYTRWHKEVVGIQKYLSMLARQVKANQYLSVRMARCLIIEHSDDFSIGDYVSIIIALARRQYGPGNLSNAKPWTVVFAGEPELLDSVKEGLITAGVAYNDGYEKVKFSSAHFDRWPIINTIGKSSKIGVTSYDVRLVSSESYKSEIVSLIAPDRVIAMSSEDIGEYKWSATPQVLQISDITIDQIKELLGV